MKKKTQAPTLFPTTNNAPRKISQSFMNSMREYISGKGCGHWMHRQWVDGELMELDSKAVRLGAYFEYIFTELMLGEGKGSLPKDGKIPLPECKKAYTDYVEAAIGNAKKKGTVAKIRKPDDGDMYAPYVLAHVNAKRLQKQFDLMGLKIIKAGWKVTKGKFEGTLDLIVEATKEITFTNKTVWKVGDRFIFDLKYAGTLDDRWDRHGWDLMGDIGKNVQKDYHGTQAMQYHFIGELPFYFCVVSSTNEIDIRLFKVTISEEAIEQHIIEGNALEEKLKMYIDIGWEPRPEISKCGKCSLAATCPDKALFPQIENVILE